MRRLLTTALAALLLGASTASAQPVLDVFGGYLYGHPDFEDAHVSTGGSLNGWLAGVDVPVFAHIGIMARADDAFGTAFRPGPVIGPRGDDVRSTLFTLSTGPRASMTRHGVTAFADALFGVAHGRAQNMGIDFLSAAEDTTFVGGVGAGVQARLTRAVGVRADVQYRRAKLFDQTLNLVQVGATVVFGVRRLP